MPTEPFPTAIILLTCGVLMAASALVSRASRRAGVPVALIFLGIGILAGKEGAGWVDFSDYGAAFRIGTAALVLILFDGGLHTPLSSFKKTLLPALILATAGVAATA